MGTFDSVYKNKIRQLEEENQQLRNILNEYYVPAFPMRFKSREEFDQLIKKPKRDIILSKFKKPDFIGNNPIDPEQAPGADVVRRTMAGDKIIEKRPSMIKPPEPTPIDGGDVYRRGMASKRNAGLRINDAQPEPAPYPSDDMESRRAAEAERARGERLRNELRGGGPQYRRTPPKSDLSFW